MKRGKKKKKEKGGKKIRLELPLHHAIHFHYGRPGVCVDTDVMKTTKGMALARLEVEGDCAIPVASLSSSLSFSSARPHPFASALSSGIARALAIDEAMLCKSSAREGVRGCDGDDDSGALPQCDDAKGSVGSSGNGNGSGDQRAVVEQEINRDLQSPAKKARASFTMAVVEDDNNDSKDDNKNNWSTCSATFSGPLGLSSCGVESSPQNHRQQKLHAETASDIIDTNLAGKVRSSSRRSNGRGEIGNIVEETTIAPPTVHHQRNRIETNDKRGDTCSIDTVEGAAAAAGVEAAGAAAAVGVRHRRGNLARRSGCQFPAGTATSSLETSTTTMTSGTGSQNQNHASLSRYALSSDSAIFDFIAAEDISMLELVGHGRFSRTHRARWKGKTVAVKTVELPGKLSTQASAAGGGDPEGAEPGGRVTRAKWS